MQRIRLNGRNKRIIIIAISIVICCICVLLDQITKNHFENLFNANYLTAERKNVVGEFFFFTLSANDGAGWSFLSGVSWAQTFFKIITIISIALMTFFFVYGVKNNSIWLQITMSIMIAGSLGNFIDRVANGFVVDFIGLDFGEYIFPIFNIADICLTVGTIMAIFYLLFLDKNALFKKNEKN